MLDESLAFIPSDQRQDILETLVSPHVRTRSS